jgi:hypothetical protein
MHDIMVEREDVCLVESVGDVGAIEKNGTSSTSSLHNNILSVHNVHMQVAITHYVATLSMLKLCSLSLYKFKL